MKTIGTLEEIGAQVGDVVRSPQYGTHTLDGLYWYKHCFSDGNYARILLGGITWRIITRAAKSPARTVTRKEIVPGVYGRVQVFDGGAVSVTYCPYSDLTAAIATLTEIRDAMQETGDHHASPL